MSTAVEHGSAATGVPAHEQSAWIISFSVPASESSQRSPASGLSVTPPTPSHTSQPVAKTQEASSTTAAAS